jgi:hypothetical protein
MITFIIHPLNMSNSSFQCKTNFWGCHKNKTYFWGFHKNPHINQLRQNSLQNLVLHIPAFIYSLLGFLLYPIFLHSNCAAKLVHRKCLFHCILTKIPNGSKRRILHFFHIYKRNYIKKLKITALAHKKYTKDHLRRGREMACRNGTQLEWL